MFLNVPPLTQCTHHLPPAATGPAGLRKLYDGMEHIVRRVVSCTPGYGADVLEHGVTACVLLTCCPGVVLEEQAHKARGDPTRVVAHEYVVACPVPESWPMKKGQR